MREPGRNELQNVKFLLSRKLKPNLVGAPQLKAKVAPPAESYEKKNC